MTHTLVLKVQVITKKAKGQGPKAKSQKPTKKLIAKG